jgi:cation diffusion facilitator family transporter
MQDDKEKVAFGSILASGGLTAAKTVVGVLSGSLAILSEAAHSLIDLGATVMTYVAVRISGKPADKEHHYGHGKVESVAALAETALLFLLSAAVTYEGIRRLTGGEPPPVEASIAAFVVIAGSVVVDFYRARLLSRVARQTSSQALEADALHFGSDMWSSLAVLIGLGGVALGFRWADAAAALVVAAFVCLAGWRLGKRTIDVLTDTAPEGAAERIATIARNVRGVVAIERIRARPVGPTLFVDLAVAVSRTLALDRVTALKAEITGAVHQAMPDTEITITTQPRALDSETILDRVMVIARNRALAVHHVTVQDIGGRLAVSLDLEVDGRMPLVQAHEIASGLETAIVEELGPGVEVETHIEPLQGYGLDGRDATPQRVGEIAEALAELAARLGPLREGHDVRVRQTADGEIVNFHCLIDPSLSVRDVHDQVDEVEQELRRRWPSIERVIGHAEPRR